MSFHAVSPVPSHSSTSLSFIFIPSHPILLVASHQIALSSNQFLSDLTSSTSLNHTTFTLQFPSHRLTCNSISSRSIPSHLTSPTSSRHMASHPTLSPVRFHLTSSIPSHPIPSHLILPAGFHDTLSCDTSFAFRSIFLHPIRYLPSTVLSHPIPCYLACLSPSLMCSIPPHLISIVPSYPFYKMYPMLRSLSHQISLVLSRPISSLLFHPIPSNTTLHDTTPHPMPFNPVCTITFHPIPCSILIVPSHLHMYCIPSYPMDTTFHHHTPPFLSHMSDSVPCHILRPIAAHRITSYPVSSHSILHVQPRHILVHPIKYYDVVSHHIPSHSVHAILTRCHTHQSPSHSTSFIPICLITSHPIPSHQILRRYRVL